jgi:hypothetical protein
MKTLKFRKLLLIEILDGRKNVTWRLFDDKDLSVGDKLEFFVWESGEKFADAKVVNVYEKKLGEIEEKDFEGHEKYSGRDEMLKTYKKYYGDRVTFDTLVKIVKFELC